MPAPIAICGLDCALCPAYLASSRVAPSQRPPAASGCAPGPQSPPPPSQGSCPGCQQGQDSRLSLCQQCAIRACGLERGYHTCAQCPDYACSPLARLLDLAPSARDNLEALRRQGQT